MTIRISHSLKQTSNYKNQQLSAITIWHIKKQIVKINTNIQFCLKFQKKKKNRIIHIYSYS